MVYLFYLAYATWRDKSAFAVDHAASGRSATSIVIKAILLNILNPKLTIFFLACACATVADSGTGDVVQPTDGIAAIGSGGAYAQAAAKALVAHSSLGAVEIVRAALEIAADLCIYTNRNIEVEELS